MFADRNSPMVISETRRWVERTVRGEYEKMAADVRREDGETETAQALDVLAARGPWTADALLSTLMDLLAWSKSDSLRVLRRLGLDRHLTPAAATIGDVEIESEPSAEDVADLIAEVTHPAPRSVGLASFVVRVLYGGDASRAHTSIARLRAAHITADRVVLAKLPEGAIRRSLVRHLRDVHGERP